MNRLPSHTSGDAADMAPDHESSTGIPRWVKVFGVVAALAIVLFIISMAGAGG
jgi:hypothetical protein